MWRRELFVRMSFMVFLFSSSLVFAVCPSGDLSGVDCFVDYKDIRLLSENWLDGYDFDDLTVVASQWLSGDPIQGIVNLISETEYETYQLAIESCGLGLYGGPGYINPGGVRNRNGTSGPGTPGNQEARLYLVDKFTEMGLSVSVQGSYLNVIGELTGTTTPDNVYIIGAHYDHLGGDRPGGDDNASGTAGVLEAARIMSQYQFESTILFIGFNAEEDGLLGSKNYVASLSTAEKNNIKGMLNLDMILRPGSDSAPARPIDVEIETNGSLPWAYAYAQVAAEYVPSIVIGDILNSGDSWSDNDSFQKAGIPAFLAIENSDGDWYPPNPIANTYYHTYEDASDRLANDPGSPSGVTYDYPFATDVTRVCAALIAREAAVMFGPPDTTPPTPDPAIFAFGPFADGDTAISMTAMTGLDSSDPVEYLFTETSGNPGGTSSVWQSSASYTNSGLTVSMEYSYTVTMRDAIGNTGITSGSASVIAGRQNIVLPVNGGNLDSFTSEYGSGYFASDLTNGVTDEDGWASATGASPPQNFVYSFSGGNSAILNEAVIHGGTAEGGLYYSKDVEVWTAANGSNFTFAGSDTLEAEANDIVTIPLGGVTAKKVKLVITSGYSTSYLDLAEFEVFGAVNE